MAGTYADVPGRRIPYHRMSVTVFSTMGSGDPATLNDEGSSEVQYWRVFGTQTPGFILPHKFDLVAGFVQFSGHGGGGEYVPNGWGWDFQTSPDTTNGTDGTWTSRAIGYAGVSTGDDPAPEYRTGIGAFTANGVKAVRFVFTDDGFDAAEVSALHLYGDPTSGENTQRLDLWHPTLDQIVGGAHFDWGDAAQGTTTDKTFRIKNRHATLTANSVVLSTEILTDDSPSIPPQITYSSDGTTFAATLNVGNLAPGAISGVLTVRRVRPSGAATGLSAWMTVADPGTWT